MFPIQRFFLPVLLAAALAGPALAQTAPADTARTYRHQLGLTASPQLDHFFTANRSLPVGLLYKQQLKPGRALRLRLVGFYSRRDTSVTYQPSITAYTGSAGPDKRMWELNAFAGYEWRHTLHHHFHWSYGVEVGGGYYHNYRPFNLQDLQIDPVTNQPFVITSNGSLSTKRWQIQGRGFGNISYDISSRLAVFAEMGIALIYSNQVLGGSYTTVPSGNQGLSKGGTYGDIRNKSLDFSFRPVQFIGLTAAF